MEQLGGSIKSTMVGAVETGLSQAHDIISLHSNLSLSERVENATTGILGFLGIYQIPDATRNLYRNVKKIFTVDGPIKKIKSLCKSIIASGDLTSLLANVGHFLYGIGVIAAGAITWTGTAVKVLLPISVLDTAFSYRKTQKQSAIFAELKGKITPLQSNKKQILSACRYVVKNQEKIEQKLAIGKEAKLAEIAIRTINDLRCHKKESVAKGKEFLATLQSRVETKMGFEVANTALKVAGVATGIFTLTTGVNPLSVTAGVVLAVAQIVTSTAEWIKVGSDPFGDAEKAWYQKFSDRIHGAFVAPVVGIYDELVARKEKFLSECAIILC